MNDKIIDMFDDLDKSALKYKDVFVVVLIVLVAIALAYYFLNRVSDMPMDTAEYGCAYECGR